jgi:hypothetical protein
MNRQRSDPFSYHYNGTQMLCNQKNPRIETFKTFCPSQSPVLLKMNSTLSSKQMKILRTQFQSNPHNFQREGKVLNGWESLKPEKKSSQNIMFAHF